METVFKKLMGWLLGEKETEKESHSKIKETKIDKEEVEKTVDDILDQHSKESETVGNKEEQELVKSKESKTETKVEEVEPKEEEIEEVKTGDAEVSKHVETQLKDIKESKPKKYKNIKEEVEDILRPLPKSEGFITRDHLVINGLRMPYLECEDCGGIASIESDEVRCGKCSKEGVLIK